MKISFDLDDTLIPSNLSTFKVEKQNWLQRILKIEPIRKGTKEIWLNLKKQGYQVGIYTTSLRKPIKIRFMLLTNNIKPDFIINEQKNRATLNKIKKSCSKYPPIFNIDIHIDDSEGVKMEGEQNNFKTIIVAPSNQKWTDLIKLKIKEYESFR